MRLSCCVQALWYDEGDKLQDTRSGCCQANESAWDDYQTMSKICTTASDLLQVRESTSAQVDVTRLGAEHVQWNKSSTTWADFAKLNSKEALTSTRTRPAFVVMTPCAAVFRCVPGTCQSTCRRRSTRRAAHTNFLRNTRGCERPTVMEPGTQRRWPQTTISTTSRSW